MKEWEVGEGNLPKCRFLGFNNKILYVCTFSYPNNGHSTKKYIKLNNIISIWALRKCRETHTLLGEIWSMRSSLKIGMGTRRSWKMGVYRCAAENGGSHAQPTASRKRIPSPHILAPSLNDPIYCTVSRCVITPYHNYSWTNLYLSYHNFGWSN